MDHNIKGAHNSGAVSGAAPPLIKGAAPSAQQKLRLRIRLLQPYLQPYFFVLYCCGIVWYCCAMCVWYFVMCLWYFCGPRLKKCAPKQAHMFWIFDQKNCGRHFVVATNFKQNGRHSPNGRTKPTGGAAARRLRRQWALGSFIGLVN